MNSSAGDQFLWTVFGLDRDRLSPLERMLLRTALAVGLFVFVWTLWDNITYAGVDLRNRVVGARTMLAGYDPYTFVWQAGMSEEWLDPVYDPKAHRLTISPPTLLVYALIAPLPSRLGRYLSFVVEWVAMLASLALFARGLPELRQRVVFLLGATFFVLASDIWRMHLERGQVYVLVLLMLAVGLRWSECGRADSIVSGIAFGIVGLMRPNLLVLAPALLILRRWHSGAAMLATVAVGAAATFLMVPTSSWRSYADVGDQYYRRLQDPDAVPDLPRPKMDGWAEGVNFDLTIHEIESSTFAVFYTELRERFHLPMLDLARTSKILLACLAGTLLCLLWWRRAAAPGAAFAFAVVVSLDTEFFLPHRWAYADVMLLAPLALLLPELLKPQPGRLFCASIILLGLVSGSLGHHFFNLYAATVLRAWFVMGGLTAAAWLSFSDDRRSQSAMPTVSAMEETRATP